MSSDLDSILIDRLIDLTSLHGAATEAQVLEHTVVWISEFFEMRSEVLIGIN